MIDEILDLKKQPSPISLMVDGNTTCPFKLLQFEKTNFPNLSKPSGNTRGSVLRLTQSEYLQPIITQYFIDNKSEIWLLFLIAHSKR